MSYNYVLSGFQSSKPIILKLVLDNEKLKKEALALKAFSGYGAVNVLIEKEGMLLLERFNPGISLRSYFPTRDNIAVTIASKLMKQLNQAPIPKNLDFPHIKDWLAVLDKDWDIPDHYLSKARKFRDKLLASSTTPVLLHGDLHHDNILQNGNEWMAIDPKGVIGETCFELTAFIRNPIPELLESPKPVNIIKKRINNFAQTLELDPERIKNFSFVAAVLSWVYALEDGCHDNHFRCLTDMVNDLC